MEEGKKEETLGAGEKDLNYNPHDLIGIQGIIEAQNREILKKKLDLRMENELYFRDHPELEIMIKIFIKKVLDEKPENILVFAGEFFDRPDLKEAMEAIYQQEKEKEKKANSINLLLQQKTSSILEEP